MKAFSTVLAGALLLGAGFAGVTGCSDDDDPPANPAGGTGGTGGSAGRGGSGGSGGSTGGTAGRGGSGGSGGSGGMSMCATPAGVAECKTRAMGGPACKALSDCACESCTCQLEACEAVPTCVAIRECVSRKGCCPTGRTDCVSGTPDCNTPEMCGAEIMAGSADMGLTLVLEVSGCVNAASEAGPHRCPLCPMGGTDGGDGGGTGGTGGAGDASTD